MAVSIEIQKLCEFFLRGLKTTLGDRLYGVYLYGALAFPEGAPTSDIDFHVILKEPLMEIEKTKLKILHATLARDFPPLGAELDGYYILLEEARQKLPPKHQILPGVTDKSWALHREHIRAGQCIILYGPDPKEIYPATTWQELEKALQGELDFVEQHLNDAPDYCVLNLCRLMYSFKTKDVVVSKYVIAQWAKDKFPEWKPLIDAARKSYARQAITQDKEFLKSKVRSFFNFACKHIRKSRNKLP